MQENILEVRDLDVTFQTKQGEIKAVEGVGFGLQRGGTLGIVGESGCGKSVTSLSILRLLPEKTTRIGERSSILFEGRDLLRTDIREMYQIRGNDIAMIFQDSMTSLNPVMRIGRQMEEVFRVHRRISRAEAARLSVELLGKVGIPAPETRVRNYPHQLSGGMRQRVIIAMALACNPKVLIADEPTTALDVTIQIQILKLMKELKQDFDTSIILITHDLGVVSSMADDILVMYTGQVVERSPAASLFREPLHPYTRALLDSIPKLNEEKDKLRCIKGMVPNLAELPKGCRFCGRCPQAEKICEERQPGLYRVGDRLVRCFRYAGAEEVER